MEPHKTKKKKTSVQLRKQSSEEDPHKMEENLCQLPVSQRINIQNIQKKPLKKQRVKETTQFKMD